MPLHGKGYKMKTKPGYKKSSAQKAMEKRTKKSNKLAKKGKLRGEFYSSGNDKPSKAAQFNNQMDNQSKSVSNNPGNVQQDKNVQAGINKLRMKEKPTKPIGTVGKSALPKRK